MKRLLLLAATFFLVSLTVQAEVSHGVLEKHKNLVFVCTGIRSCIPIARALNANFHEIYGIDADQVLVDHAAFVLPVYINEKPRQLRKFRLYCGEPQVELAKVIADIKKPITFLLSSYIPDADGNGDKNMVLEELESIKKHCIKRHTIMVENIHYAGTAMFDYVSLSSIMEKILEINPRYIFSFEKGGHLENEEGAILVASLP